MRIPMGIPDAVAGSAVRAGEIKMDPLLTKNAIYTIMEI